MKLSKEEVKYIIDNTARLAIKHNEPALWKVLLEAGVFISCMGVLYLCLYLLQIFNLITNTFILISVMGVCLVFFIYMLLAGTDMLIARIIVWSERR